MRLTLTIDKAFDKWANAFGELAERVHIPLARAMNHEGAKAATAVRRALARQTGLRYSVTKRAVREGKASQGNPRRGYEGASLTFSLESSGGNIRIRHFGTPRETRAGVIAKPWNRAQLYVGSFLRGGSWPKRVPLQKLGGHAYHRVGGSRLPIAQTRSNLFIADEMISGQSAQAFDDAFGASLEKRISHELYRMLK